MKLAILGAGAVGCAYGYLLSQGGHDVVLLDVWREHVEAMRDYGLRVQGTDGELPAQPVTATTDVAAVEDAEAVLVLVKAFSTDAAAARLAGRLRPDAVVVTLQNGIGNDAVLARRLGADAIVQGSTTVGAQIRGPGRVSVVEATLRGESVTTLGRPSHAPHAAACERLAGALEQARLPTVVMDDVRAVVWRKMAMAAAIGPLCAILGCTVADVLTRPPALDVLRRTFGEIVAVARAERVEFDADELWAHALATYRAIGPHPPSLAVDVERGRPTEIEAQLGEVQRRGRAAGIPTPASDVFSAVIRAKAVAGVTPSLRPRALPKEAPA
jgi:2-dehydropantoate 2-reductase